MNSTLARIQALWVSLGSLLVIIGATSKFPWLVDLFSQTFVDAALVAGGAVVAFYQFVRAIFAAKFADIKALSSGDIASYLFNPFKIAA